MVATPSPKPRSATVRLDEVNEAPIEWVWPGYLPRARLIIGDGDPGIGKSTATLNVAAGLTCGRLPDGTATAPGNVLVMTAEDNLDDTVKPRLRAAGADMQRVYAWQGVMQTVDGQEELRTIALPDDIEELRRLVVAHDITLAIIDPVVAYLHLQVDSWKDQHVRRVLAGVKDVAEETGATVIGLRHLTKAGGSKAIYRGQGTIGFIGAARLAWMFGHDPDDQTENPSARRRVLAVQKVNIAEVAPSLLFNIVPFSYEHDGREIETSRIEWRGTTTVTADDLMVEDDPYSATADAVAFLRDELTVGPRAATTIYQHAGQAGISRRALRQAKSRLKVKSVKLGLMQGWVWQLPLVPNQRASSVPSNMTTADVNGQVPSNMPLGSVRAREDSDEVWTGEEVESDG